MMASFALVKKKLTWWGRVSLAREIASNVRSRQTTFVRSVAPRDRSGKS